MDYFYTPPPFIKGNIISIEGEELHHLSKVLRKKVGDEIFVVDGFGEGYRVALQSITRSEAKGEIQEVRHHWNEPDVDITLAFALLKNPSRIDVMIEKCTELGVREFYPMTTERTIAARLHRERLQKIALSAMKQCGRSYLPPIHPLLNFTDALSLLRNRERKFITHETAEVPKNGERKDAVKGRGKTVAALIGPEGGFTEDEVQSAVENGFRVLSLGPRRLRSETAAIAVLSLLGP
jgi:16S rRNA (uracil1498-N3)-methyltransferase